jgi:CRISPR/Cas system-associated exonuclease Cas4 (RecB family)
MARTKRTIRASEIGSFLYCQRAWWYRRKNVPAINTAELAGGENFHRLHVGQTRGARVLKIIAWILLSLALILVILFFGR